MRVITLILFCGLFLGASATNRDSARIHPLDSVISEMGLPAQASVDTALIYFVNDWLGTRYCYGGKSRSGVDCSGFASLVYKQVYDIDLDRVSTVIYQNSNKVKKKNLEQGDLVFFKTNGRSRVNHVGVYLWDGYFVHSSTKLGVIISRLDEGYYERTFVSGGRY